MSPSRLFERCKCKQFAGTVQVFEEKNLILRDLCLPFSLIQRLGGSIVVENGLCPINAPPCQNLLCLPDFVTTYRKSHSTKPIVTGIQPGIPITLYQKR